MRLMNVFLIDCCPHDSRNTKVSIFWDNQIFGFPWCSSSEDLSIDVSITNVGLILTKLRWFQLFVKSQNSNFELFWKKNQIFGFPCRSTREDLSIDVSIANVGLILTKLYKVISFLGVRTDRQTWFRNPHMEACRHTKNFNSNLKTKS